MDMKTRVAGVAPDNKVFSSERFNSNPFRGPSFQQIPTIQLEEAHTDVRVKCFALKAEKPPQSAGQIPEHPDSRVCTWSSNSIGMPGFLPVAHRQQAIS